MSYIAAAVARLQRTTAALAYDVYVLLSLVYAPDLEVLYWQDHTGTDMDRFQTKLTGMDPSIHDIDNNMFDNKFDTIWVEFSDTDTWEVYLGITAMLTDQMVCVTRISRAKWGLNVNPKLETDEVPIGLVLLWVVS